MPRCYTSPTWPPGAPAPPRRGWPPRVGGLVARPRTFDLDDLAREFDLEERLYRHRCVEAWAMAVPWTAAGTVAGR